MGRHNNKSVSYSQCCVHPNNQLKSPIQLGFVHEEYPGLYLSTNKVLALAMLIVIISKKKEGKIVVRTSSRKIKGNNACCEFRRSSKGN